jgi:elongation factor G
VLGSDSVEHKAVVRALVPQSELSRYAIDLRGIGHGSGTFTRSFHGYELLPSNLVEKFAKS